MAFQQKENSGALFANDNREKDTHPTHTGTCNIQGAEFYISAWVKESQNGRKFFSLAFKPKEARAQQQSRPQPKQDFEEEIPF